MITVNILVSFLIIFWYSWDNKRGVNVHYCNRRIFTRPQRRVQFSCSVMSDSLQPHGLQTQLSMSSWCLGQLMLHGQGPRACWELLFKWWIVLCYRRHSLASKTCRIPWHPPPTGACQTPHHTLIHQKYLQHHWIYCVIMVQAARKLIF